MVWGLLKRFNISIHFAHRTFPWHSEAQGKAHVHVVIIGFAAFDIPVKRIFNYGGIYTDDWSDDSSSRLRETPPKEEKISVTETGNITPYLTPGSIGIVHKRQTPLCNVPEIRCGNKPSDGGHLIFTDEEKERLLQSEPGAGEYLRRFTGSEEFINGNMRWCLWLADADPTRLRQLPLVMERIKAVQEFRRKSSAAPTRKAALTPTLFFYTSQPKTQYILIPEVSSERRRYIPLGFVAPEIISANTNFLIAEPTIFIFGVLTSKMHMAWIRRFGGRLKSDYRYSGSMVYNTFPWPENPTPKQRASVEAAAQGVLDARAEFPNATLADLYDPLSMPPTLVRAHAALDRAVDLCYRSQPFENDSQRVEHLFALYERLTAPLLPAAPKTRRSRSKG
jgi:hypothetical protein